MTTEQFEQELEQNRRAYGLLREQIRRDHSGKYIGMAFGKIVLVGDDYDAVTAAMDSLDPAPACSLVFPAEEEPLFDPPNSPPRFELEDECPKRAG